MKKNSNVEAASIDTAGRTGGNGGKTGHCRPVISGPLWAMSAGPASEGSALWSIDQWRDELDEQQLLGFDLIWLCHTYTIPDRSQDMLGRLLDLCADRKLQVILDIGSYNGSWYEVLDLKGELEICSKGIRRIGERYAGHQAFYAWYIPHEIYACWGDFGEYIDGLYPALVEQCRKAADIPVTLSPFFILDKEKVFGNYRYAEPEEYSEYWAGLIKRSRFDIIMLQDSGEHFSFSTIDQRRPFFEAMQAACRASGAKLWGNVETAEYVCASMEDYIRLYGRVPHATVPGIPWRAVPIGRLKDKLELAATYSERIVTWGYREYCRPALGPDARKWYDDYKDYYTQPR